MNTKIWYRSKELWIFFVLIIISLGKALGVEILNEGTIKEAGNVYIVAAPLLMAILRIFTQRINLYFNPDYSRNKT